MLGDRGLCGLMGALLFSFPPDLDRIASDNVEDFGILRTCLRGCLCCYCPLSVTLASYRTIRSSVCCGQVPRRKGTPPRWPRIANRWVCGRASGASQAGGVWKVLVNTIHGSRQSRKSDREWLRYRRVCVCCPCCQRVRDMGRAKGKVQRVKGRGRWYEP